MRIIVVFSPGTKYEVREMLPLDELEKPVNRQLDNIHKQRIKSREYYNM